MIPSSRLLWLLGAIVCVAVLAAACSSPPPSGTEERLLPTSGGTPSPGQPFTTPAMATQALQISTSALPASTPTTAEPPDTGGHEIRLTPTEPLILDPVPTLTGEAVTGEIPEDLLNAILADAADRSGLPARAFAVIWAEAVTWRDGSLGCPQPGVAYAQVLTQGFRVMLEAGGQFYEYHTGPAQAIVLCEIEAPAPRSDPAPSGMPPILSEEIITAPVNEDLGKLIDIAEQDLAKRLQIALAEIEVVQIQRAEWPDSSLGCGQPGLARLPVAIAGYRIVLTAEGREHVYHTGRESGVVYCPKG